MDFDTFYRTLLFLKYNITNHCMKKHMYSIYFSYIPVFTKHLLNLFLLWPILWPVIRLPPLVNNQKKKRGNARKRVGRVSWRKILTNLIRSMLWQPELITRFFQVWRIGNVVNNPHSDGNSFQIICGGVDCARTIRRQLWSSKTWSGQWLTTTQHEVPLWFLYYQYKLCYHQCQ